MEMQINRLRGAVVATIRSVRIPKNRGIGAGYPPQGRPSPAGSEPGAYPAASHPYRDQIGERSLGILSNPSVAVRPSA